MAEIFLYENDNIIELLGLEDNITGVKQDGKTVAITLTDETGTNVVGETWPLTMSAEGGSTGNYRATLKDSLTVTVDKEYFAKVTVKDGVNLQATFNARVRVVERGDT